MSAAKLALMALGAVGLGVAAVAAFAGMPKRDEVEPDVEQLPALVVSAGELAAHRSARPILVEAARRVLGRDATPAELQYLHGVAWLETNYGRGWKGDMAAANNWGAVSCNPATMDAAVCVPGQTDHGSGGVAYTTGFRRYATPVDGAADVVKNVLKQRPRTAAALASSSKPSTHRASLAMRRERYYGGICREAAQQYGTAAAEASFGAPDRDDGTKACERENVGAHAKLVFRHARAVAQALGEPLALRLGTFDDARSWWSGEGAAHVAGPDVVNDAPRVLQLAAPHWDTTELG